MLHIERVPHLRAGGIEASGPRRISKGNGMATAGDIPRRRLGRTGAMVSIVGVGGFHLGRPADAKEAIAIVRTALDAGVNFLDNCWDYNNGASEERMGLALQDGYRRKAF